MSGKKPLPEVNYTIFPVTQTVDIVQETVFQGHDILTKRGGSHAASGVLSNSGLASTPFKWLSVHTLQVSVL